MQQLYLTGDGASASAAQLMNALNVPFSGFRLTPVHPGGQPARRSAAPAASAAKASAERRAVPRPADGKRLAAPAAGDGGNRRAGAVRNVQHAHAHPHRPD